MYPSEKTNWIKHLDFILLDLVILELSYYLADVIRNGTAHFFTNEIYVNVGLVLILVDLVVAFSISSYSGILRRGHIKELKSVLYQIGWVFSLTLAFIFLEAYGRIFSRAVYLYFITICIPLTWAGRTLLKSYVRNTVTGEQKSILILTSSDIAETVVRRFLNNSYHEYKIAGVSLIDTDSQIGKTICNVPVVCSHGDIYDFIQTRWVDEILVNASKKYAVPDRLSLHCEEMGITMHMNLAGVDEMSQNMTVEKIGGYVVLTTSLRVATVRQMVLKRLVDVIGSVIGLVLTFVLTILIGPIIYFASPGPIFYSQKRIGKNGKPFMMHKFRSMYPDADQKKSALQNKNKMKGLMFKVDEDPRIIGSGPDGTRHGIGWFIRKTSIDEFPQFLNVLMGEMSLVGTRPPTEDEWKKYEMHHRARLAIKPGITGLWQVSGRSDITDFEKVVALDLQYIREWSLGEDIKILWKTVKVVLLGEGSE